MFLVPKRTARQHAAVCLYFHVAVFACLTVYGGRLFHVHGTLSDVPVARLYLSFSGRGSSDILSPRLHSVPRPQRRPPRHVMFSPIGAVAPAALSLYLPSPPAPALQLSACPVL